MKKQFFLLLSAIALVSASYAQTIQSIAIGTATPSATVKLKDISGKQVSLADVKGENGLLVMFTCNTCPYVVKNQQRTKEVCSYAKANGLGVILINSNGTYGGASDSPDAMKAYASAQGYDWYYASDDGTKVADAFGAARTPEVFVFNKNDKLIYKGAIDDNPGNADAVKNTYLKTAIDASVNGKDVSVKESKSVGCSIKRAS